MSLKFFDKILKEKSFKFTKIKKITLCLVKKNHRDDKKSLQPRDIDQHSDTRSKKNHEIGTNWNKWEL